MKNNISIDELVRRHASQGEEPHNLSAWANMERMLDGQNPYEKEKEDKKRPLLFLFFGLLLCSTAVVGGYQYFSVGDSSQNTIVASSPSTNNIANNENLSVTNDSEALDFSEPSNSKDDYGSTTYHEETQSDEYKTSNSSSTNTAEEDAFVNATASLKNEVLASNPFDTKDNKIAQANTSTTKGGSSNTIKTNAKIENTNENKSTAIAANAKVQSENLAMAKNDQADVAEYAKKEPLIDAQQKEVQPVITEKYKVTTPVTKITQRIEGRGRNKRYVADSVRYTIEQEKKRLVVNPRYVVLSQEQEKAAQRKTAPINPTNYSAPSVASKIPSAANKAEANSTASQQKVGLVSNAQQKNKKGFFSLFKKAAQSVNQKAINVAHTRFPIYTGMFAGINAALLNTQHNFGGFQTGLTAMTPLSRIFTLQTELRFTHMNNSAYTIRDNRKELLSSTIDSTSVFKSKIYNYQVDSISKGYNLQNFYSMQMPILLNANFNKFSAYAGLNVHYGFRMNIKSSQQSNIITIMDTVADGIAYTPRSSTEMKFTTEDFGSRFGFGYTVGGAYNFNPNLYIDLRMSNPIWDNTQGVAKQEISDVFFKIPSFQLSLGYRFRKFKPE